MKVSVSLPDSDVAFLDAYADEHGLSRSAAVQAAVRSLRDVDLAAAYELAFAADDEEAGETAMWDIAAGDGLDAAS